MQSHFLFKGIFIRVRIQVDFVDSSYERNVICICFGNIYNVTFDGETLKPRENGTKDKSSIPGYEFVRTEKDKEGNTVHIYRKVTSSTPEVKEKETSYVGENGKEIRSTKKGTYPKETIPGYEFVRTETESNGNVRHVYRQVVHSESKVETPTTVEEHKNELPNTGTGDEFTIFGAAAASILAGLGIAIPGKKKEE